MIHYGRRNLQRTAPLHALTILPRCLGPRLSGIHARRLATWFEAVAATGCGPRLTLTDIGRRFGGEASLRNRIKRSDRLLGNQHLQGQARTIYAVLARKRLSGVPEPLMVIAWSDLKADHSLHLLPASRPVGGRRLTRDEEVHPQGKLGKRQGQPRFLPRLAQMLPASAEPISVADAGFKVPFFREVERLGWRWGGRVRGRDYVQRQRWTSCKRLFEEATTTPTCLGTGEWIRSNPLCAILVLVRLPRQGRQAKTAAGKRARSKKSKQAARSAREPWRRGASPRFAAWPAKRLVRVYRQRMQLELSLRDLKREHFGAGLERRASSGTGRFTVLVLIASLAAILLWLIGTAAERSGRHERFRPGSRKRCAYSRLFLARLLLTVEPCNAAAADRAAAIGPLNQWVATDHAALLTA